MNSQDFNLQLVDTAGQVSCLFCHQQVRFSHLDLCLFLIITSGFADVLTCAPKSHRRESVELDVPNFPEAIISFCIGRDAILLCALLSNIQDNALSLFVG